MYAPFGIGRRTGQTFRFLVCARQVRLHPGKTRRDVGATRETLRYPLRIIRPLAQEEPQSLRERDSPLAATCCRKAAHWVYH
jgi:hypothetical protein